MPFQITNQSMLRGVRPQYVAAAKISLPVLEHRTKIQVHDVILTNAPIGGVIIVGEQGVGSTAGERLCQWRRNPNCE